MSDSKIEVCELVTYLPMMILFVLDQAEGLLLAEDIEKRLDIYFSKHVDVNGDSVKTTLSRLKKTDLINATKEKSVRIIKGGRKRDLFSITRKGRQKFKLTREFMSVFYIGE